MEKKIKTSNPNKLPSGFYKKKLDKMIESGEYIWAEKYLMDLLDQLNKKGSLSKKQVQAIGNIKRSIQ